MIRRPPRSPPFPYPPLFRPAPPNPAEASRPAPEPLALECGQAREGRALLELHDPAEPGFVRRHGGVDVAAVQRIARLEPQCVARAQPTRFRAPRPDQRVPQLLEVRSEERRVGKECRSRWSP